MHSVSIYPCDEKILNLNLIKTLQQKFKCEVGYSGHESTEVQLLLLILWVQTISRDILHWIELAGEQINQRRLKKKVWKTYHFVKKNTIDFRRWKKRFYLKKKSR